MAPDQIGVARTAGELEGGFVGHPAPAKLTQGSGLFFHTGSKRSLFPIRLKLA